MREVPNVLSMQSEVVRGHVGNGAARPALYQLGINVWAVPTVLLSNHPGHGKSRQEPTPQFYREPAEFLAARVESLIDGLAQHDGWLAQCDGVLSGYLGSASQAVVVANAVGKVKEANPKALFLCDPVFGDNGREYTAPGVKEAIQRELLPLADIVTPNCFELERLTGAEVTDSASAVLAARKLNKPEVVITSVPFSDGQIGTMVVTAAGSWLAVATKLEKVPSGSGDLFAALYLASRLKGGHPEAALARASSSVDCVIRASVEQRADEMVLIARRSDLAEPSQWLTVNALL